MAATNYTPIQLYYSTTASAVPLAANLAQGELAINITDGKLYYEDNAGVVQVIATKGAGTIGGSTTQIQYNNAGALAGSSAMTFNNSTNVVTLATLNLTNALGATYGGTAQSSYTQGDLLYSSATNTLSKLGIGTVDYILTSTGSVPQWSAPSSISVLTATNLAGGAAGSVPYQSAASTTTFLAIGAANRVMTSSGTAPQWVTALTGLTGVSSSSITNTSLTSGRVVYSTTGGAQTDDADLTFNGTTLSAGGYSTSGLSTLVKTVTIGNSNFDGSAVFAAATPAKLYIGTGTVTDTTSAIGATNAVGAISSLAITPIAATNTSVTYTNAATLYIAGAPSAGTNVTITNPYSLYVAAGDAYFGGTVTAGTVNLTTLDLTNLEVTNIKAKDGTASMSIADSTGVVTVVKDQVVNGLTVGRGAGAVSTNTAVGASALAANTSGNGATAVGASALAGINTSAYATAVGYNALNANTSGEANAGFGAYSLFKTTSGAYNTGAGVGALQNNTTASNNTALGYQAGYSNQTGASNTFVGYQVGYGATGSTNVAVGANVPGFYNASLYSTTGSGNTALGAGAGGGITSGSTNIAIGQTAMANGAVTGSTNIAIGWGAGINLTSGSSNTFVGSGKAGFQNGAGSSMTTGSANTILGSFSGNQGGLDIRTSNNYIVLSDGDGNPRMFWNGANAQQSGALMVTGANRFYSNATTGSNPGWWKLGTIVLSASRAAVIRLLGTQSFSAGSAIAGEGVIHLRYDNGTSFVGTWWNEGQVGASTLVAVRINNSTGELYANLGSFQELAIECDSSDSVTWTPSLNYVSASGSPPASTTDIAFGMSINNTNVGTTFNSYGIGLNSIPSSGMGLTFPATQDASSNANTLDDYEEGTWTPVLTEAGTDRSPTYQSQGGRYVKIGNTVYCQFGIALTNKGTGSGSGQIRIEGLPFTSASFGSYQEPTVKFFGGGFTTAATVNSLLQVPGGGAYLRGWLADNAGAGVGATATPYTEVTNNSFFAGEIFYNV